MFHHYDNAINRYGVDLEPSDTVDEYPGLGVIYLTRLAIRGAKTGCFQLVHCGHSITAPAITTKARRLRSGSHVTNQEASVWYATPDWVFEAGRDRLSSSGRGSSSSRSPRYEPDYADPIFIEKLDHFLAAAAERYDGNPNVAFIDVGSIGVWGEGDPQVPQTHVSAAVINAHIDLHIKHFKKTLVVFNDNLIFRGRGIVTMEILHRDVGLTLRDDSVLVVRARRLFTRIYLRMLSGLAYQLFWKANTGVFSKAKQRGDWGRRGTHRKPLRKPMSVMYPATGIRGNSLENNRELVNKISLRMDIVCSLPKRPTQRVFLLLAQRRVRMIWRNAGVMPCLTGGFATLTFKDAKKGIAGVFVDEELDMRTLPVVRR